jgi:lipopolysaccharide/colanic/teichoic acid biosynthesis glycosyltransferase
MYKRFIKRALDFIAAVLAIIILMPVYGIVSVGIFVSMGWPIVYLQNRVGRNLKILKIFKFRTMVKNADQIGPYMTAQNDERITPVGGFLRKTSLDEIPQLFNVLLGSMSLVGPRPDVPAQEKLYVPQTWVLRHTEHPGITGLAQVLYRSNATMEQRIAADLKYVQEVSFILDIKIILKTITIVFRRTNTN